MAEQVGEFVYNKKDLIGHGAFAVVFKGHHKKVKTIFHIIFEAQKVKLLSSAVFSSACDVSLHIHR